MYNSINELPTQVLNALDEEDAGKWMEAYNSFDPRTEEDVAVAKRRAWESVRNLPSSFAFDIVATVEDVDSDGELITLDSVKGLMDGYIQRGGVIQDMHGNYNVGVIHGWEDYTDPKTGYPGILVHGNVFGGSGTNQEYIRARQDFINGKNSLSIGGDATVEGYECDEERCFVRRNMEELMEISLCTVPANPYAKLVWYNDKAVIKSEGDVSLKVSDIHIHKSYNECRLEAERRSIEKGCRDAGLDAVCRVAKDGCRVRLRGQAEEVAFLADVAKGRYVAYDRSSQEFIVDSMAHRVEQVFKDCLRKGYIDSDGRVLPSMTIGVFKRMMSDGMLVKSGPHWCMDSSLVKGEGAMTAGTSGAVNPRYSDGQCDCDDDVIGFREMSRWMDDNLPEGETPYEVVPKDEVDADTMSRHNVEIEGDVAYIQTDSVKKH